MTTVTTQPTQQQSADRQQGTTPTAPHLVTELPGPRTQEILDRDGAVTSPSLPRAYPLAPRRGYGSTIEDVDGNVFADHVSAWGAAPYGAQPPLVRDAVTGAWDRYGMEISQYLASEPVVTLAERLVALAPGAITRAAPTVTGCAEAGVLSALCLDAAPDADEVHFSLRDAAGTRRADRVHLLAVGRWL